MAVTTHEEQVTADQEAMKEARVGVREEEDGQHAIDSPATWRQLTFDVGGGRSGPDVALVKVSGDLALYRDLKRQQSLEVHVVDTNGEVLCSLPATVTAITFKDKTDKDGITTVQRIHTVTLDKDFD